MVAGHRTIKGTRIPVALIFELIGLNYTIDEILKEYPNVNRQIIIKIVDLGKDAIENLSKENLEKVLSKKVH